MHKQKFLNIVLFILFNNALWAQNNAQILAGDKILTVNYSAGFPVGSLHNFINNKTLGGLNVDYRSFITDKFSAGVSIGWNNFKKQFDRATYPNGNGSYSAVQTKYFYTVPFLVTGSYHFTTNQKINPYILLGAGINLVNYNKWDGAYGDNKSKVAFGARVGAGILVPFSDTIGLNLAARYSYAAFSYNEISNIQYPDISVGLYFLSF